MNVKLIILAVLVCALGSSIRVLSAAEMTMAEARELAAPLVQAERADGLSVGVIDGKRQFTFHLGRTKQGQRVADDRTLYEIGSVSKVFTGILLADAAVADEGMLQQTPGVDVTTVPLPKWQEQSITWLDMATHRSGLPRLPDNLQDAESDNPYASYDSTKALDFLREHKLRRAPGTEFEYSNFAVSWLGYMLSKRAGVTYEELLSDRIAKPLEMSDTVISLSPDQRQRLAMPHAEHGNETSTWDFADLPGAGGIRSTMADMMKFVAANLNRPQGRIGDAIELAWKQHRPSDGESFAMGLGWMIARDGQTRWHNGQTGGYHSAVFINRKLNLGVVVLANTGTVNEVDTLAEMLVQRLAGMQVEPIKIAKEIEVDAAAMARLEGRYELAPTFVFDVKVDKGRLMVGVTNQPTLQVYAKSATRWFYKVIDAELEFKLGETGSAHSLVLHQNGIRQTAKRVE